MTSLFSRLQKLNTVLRQELLAAVVTPPYVRVDALIVADSLPAVLNLIEAAQRFCDDDSVRGLSDHWAFPVDEFKALAEAVAVFVSGQEEPK